MENKRSLTELEKQIYNKHLAVSRSKRNKPFKLKTNFLDIENTAKHKFLTRISTLVHKHPEINLDIFFSAPYDLYRDVQYFDLEYFASMRAVKSYTTYKQQLLLKDPDLQLDSIKDSLKFICHFCIENNIKFYQYHLHKTADLFTWMKHYKENKINIYSVMEFKDIYSSAKQLTEEVQKFFLSTFLENFQTFYFKYNNSNIIKPYIQKAFPILSNFVQTQLTSSSKSLLY